MKWRRKVIHKEDQSQDLFMSSIYNEQTFYSQFITDLQTAAKEVIIERPNTFKLVFRDSFAVISVHLTRIISFKKNQFKSAALRLEP